MRRKPAPPLAHGVLLGGALVALGAACAGRVARGPDEDADVESPIDTRRADRPLDVDGPAPDRVPDAAAPPSGDGPASDGPASDGPASADVAGDAAPVARDPYLWPFSPTSIWNMPIGSGAVFKPARLEAAAHVGNDIQHILKLRATDPLRPVYASTSFSGPRCQGMTSINLSLRVPDDWIVPDTGKGNPYGLTPNANFAFLTEDGDTVFEGSMITRCMAGGPIYLPDWVKYPANQYKQSIRGDGLGGGGQGASGLSALGGTIRLGELVGAPPIPHVIKINPWAKKYLHYSTAVKGFRWPAKRADGYASNPGEYDPASFGRTDDPSLVMGTLLAIPGDVKEASLGLSTKPGRKLFRVLQDYGAYFTEDAAWDTWDLIIERDAEKEFADAYGFTTGSAQWKADVNKLMQALHIVDNNGPQSIGGGGPPRVPLAPPLRAP